MVNYKSKYLEMKLKYINAKQNGGTLANGEIHPSMRIAILNKLAVDIKNTHNTSKMAEFLQIMNINATFRNYVINNHNDTYSSILLHFVREEITNGNGRVNLNIIIPHLVSTSTVFTPTQILDVILFALPNSGITRPENLIDLAAQIAYLINIHNATINPDLIRRSDNDITPPVGCVMARGFIYAELHYIHNIPIYHYFVDEPLANMPTRVVNDEAGNYVTDVVEEPKQKYYAAYPNPNQAYADAIIQFNMQIRRLQLNIIRHSAYIMEEYRVGGIVPLYTYSMVILRGRIRKLGDNYVNHYNP